MCCLADKRYHRPIYYVGSTIITVLILSLYVVPLTVIFYFLFPKMNLGVNIPCFFLNIVLFAIVLVSYFRTMFCDVAVDSVLVREKLISISGKDEENNIDQWPQLCTSVGWKFCEKCQLPKPPRSHHCSTCKQCVLAMDHHCPWMNTCVGYKNHKFFVLYLFWSIVIIIFNTFLTTTGLAMTYKSLEDEAMFLGGALLFMVCMLFVLVPFTFTHVKYVMNNEGTLDDTKKDHKTQNKYFINTYDNWRQIFGSNKFLWFIPIETQIGDGMSFPLNPYFVGENEDSDS